MKVIKAGTTTPLPTYTGTCPNCTCVFECTKVDIIRGREWNSYDTVEFVRCPHCLSRIGRAKLKLVEEE